MNWDKLRALQGFLEVANSALQSAQAICPEDKPDESRAGLIDEIFAAREILNQANQKLEQLAKDSHEPET